jgi:hypothetical protein
MENYSWPEGRKTLDNPDVIMLTPKTPMFSIGVQSIGEWKNLNDDLLLHVKELIFTI